jgi:hypothetical protein
VGDQFGFPERFLDISANPLKGVAALTPDGISRFAEEVFGVRSLKPDRQDFPTTIRALIKSNESFYKDALQGIDSSDPAKTNDMFRWLTGNKQTVAWWGYMAANFCAAALAAIEDKNAAEAAWAMTGAERFRALAIFKQEFEDVVSMGHSARRLVELMHIWDSNKDNDDEAFWQRRLSENAYAISQLFSVPVTFIQGRAYVGGTTLEGTDARLLDLLFSGGSANEAILVEIKTPKTPLLGNQYRTNAYPPSRDLGGSIVQVNDYCHSLRGYLLTQHRSSELSTFNPRRVVIIGNYERELTDSKKKSSFELFRTSLAGVDLITFDEFFKKIEHLAKLFNLVRTVTCGVGS